MFVFVTMHLSNHALGLISLAAAEHARLWFLLFWRNPVGTVVFYGAVVVHVLLVFRAIYLRRTFSMPLAEAFQIFTGLLVPLLIIDHVLATRVVHAVYGYIDNYHAIVRSLWISSPMNGVRQTLALLVVWVHGCIGVHFWLRYRPWYTRITPLLLAVAILLPVLGLLGFATMGRTLTFLSTQSEEHGYAGTDFNDRQTIDGRDAAPRDEVAASILPYRVGLYGAFCLTIVLLFFFRSVRRWRERAHQVAIRYPGGEIVRVPRGFTVLEASRLGGLPHYAVCGGRGQCSTCRVQVIEGEAGLSPPEAIERETLNRIGAMPGVRLACQLRPTHDIKVAPQLVPGAETAVPANTQPASPGREREVVVFFCDIRQFTTLTEARLPFDIVFLLNRYFAIVGKAVENAGGRLDKFIGDGAMALFGLRQTRDNACRQALKAAAEIIREVDKLGEELADELVIPLRLAIGIHIGPAVVGSMGYGNVVNLTAIGDTVNVASRLESVAKEFDAALVFSEPLAIGSEVDVSDITSREIAVRGRSEPLRVYMVSKEEVGRFA